MGKATYLGLSKPDDPIHEEWTIVIGRPWYTTKEDIRKMKAREKAKASDEKKEA